MLRHERKNMKTEESLLSAWLNMSICIRGNRLVSAIPFNEILICNILYRQKLQSQDFLTATDLCERTRLLKSQINQLLTSMEKKGLIERIRSKEDKRKIMVRLKEEKMDIYLKEHEKILLLLQALVTDIGSKKAQQLTELLNEATASMVKIETKR